MPDLPPSILHSSREIPQRHAQTMLSLYLNAARHTPYLQPNSLLSEEGPKSRSIGSSSSLVLHNLERVQSGLKGDYVGRDPALLSVGRREKPRWRDHIDGKIAGKGGERGEKGKQKRGGVRKDEAAEEGQDWQDGVEYDLEQEDVVGDVAEREPENADSVEEVRHGDPGVLETERAMKAEKGGKNKRKKERSTKEDGDANAERKKKMEEKTVEPKMPPSEVQEVKETKKKRSKDADPSPQTEDKKRKDSKFHDRLPEVEVKRKKKKSRMPD